MIALPEGTPDQPQERGVIQFFSQIGVIWEKPKHVNEFKYPKIFAKQDFGEKIGVLLGVTKGYQRFSDAFVELLVKFVHAGLREKIERPLFDLWSEVVMSPEYKDAFVAWSEYLTKKSKDDPNCVDQIVLKASN